MNKFFTTLILILSALNMLHAQDGYLKFKKDTELSGKKFYKGDMLGYAATNFSTFLLYNLQDRNIAAARQYRATVDRNIANLGFRVPDKSTGR